MWNNRLKRLLITSCLAGSLLLSGCAAETAETAAQEETPAAAVPEETAAPPDLSAAKIVLPDKKEETVSVKADAAGNPEKTTVLVCLSAAGRDGFLLDRSALTEIRNREGDEEFWEDGGLLYWENHGEDIEYEGTGQDPLPVGVQITYFLNGHETDPEQLAGKSGHVKLRFDYENRTAGNGASSDDPSDGIVPFYAVSLCFFPEDTLENITVTNGRALSIGGQDVVMGLALPGIADALELSGRELTEEAELPDYVELEGDTQSFELSFTATLFGTGLLGEEAGEALDDADELAGNMKDLAEASAELADGASKLSDALETYEGYLTQYTEGASALGKGAGELADGIAALKENAAALQKGAETLSESLAGLDALWEAYPLDKLPLDKLEPAARKLGLLKDRESLAELIGGLRTMTGQLAEGGAQLAEGLGAFSQGLSQLDGGASQLKEAAGQLPQAGEALTGGYEAILEGVREFADGLSEFDEEGIQELSGLAGDDLADLAARLRTLQLADAAYTNYSGLPDGVEGSVRFLIETEEIR